MISLAPSGWSVLCRPATTPRRGVTTSQDRGYLGAPTLAGLCPTFARVRLQGRICRLRMLP